MHRMHEISYGKENSKKQFSRARESEEARRERTWRRETQKREKVGVERSERGGISSSSSSSSLLRA